MIPIIEKTVVEEKEWLTPEEFLDALAVTQSSPGVLAANMSTFIGHQIKGFWGAVVSCVGALLPSYLIITLIATFFMDFRNYPIVDYAFMGIRPAVAALILSAVVSMMRKSHMTPPKALIMAGVAIGVGVFGLSPILFLLAGGIGSIVYDKIKKDTNEKLGDTMLEKLSFIENTFQELEKKLMDPNIINDMDQYQTVAKEHSDLVPIVELYRAYKKNDEIMKEDKEMLEMSDDEEMNALLKQEISAREEEMEQQEQQMQVLLLPKDPNDHKNVIVEIRAGAGGDEAGLFAGNLYRMYVRYAERNRWAVDLMSMNEQGIGGVKEAIFMINGKGAYSRLKYESGVHRVQRVPQTESSGRIHTSTATVAVLPEAEDVDVEISEKDIRVDVFRSSGNGGQSVNTTDSAVRITHLPTGMVVSCQDEKSQLKNKDKAMKILKSRLYDQMLEEQAKEISQDRRSQVGTGDRSERIRTYNYPQGRITDHRINKTIHQLENFLDGDIDEMIDALTTEDQAKKLQEVG